MMMVAAFSHSQPPPESTHHEDTPKKWSPLNDNGSTVKRKPRGRQVPSRYLSPSSSAATTMAAAAATKLPTRFPSPLLSRSTNTTAVATMGNKTATVLPKRSQSVDRRRPGDHVSTELSAATKMLITSSRSLSVSFQGESFSIPVSKAKPQGGSTRKAVTPEGRKTTPVRDHGENSKPVDRHRWPGRTREGNSNSGSGSNPLSRSLDCYDERKTLGSGAVMVKSLQQSLMLDANYVNEVSYDLTASDTDSVSSGSTNGGNSKGRNGSHNILVSARFWQETNSRLRRLQDPGSPLFTSPGSRISAPKSLGSTRPASPSKLWTSSASSPLRGLSPARVRNAVGGAQMLGNSVNSPSILSFSADIRRGRMGEDRIVDAHTLRLLYNRYLQWRFANARAEATFMVQELSAEQKNLWNVWVTISELLHSVTLKRMKFLLLRQKLKLTSILKGQIAHLEAWAVLDRDHSSSLLGATEALKASTLRLPIVGKAIVDIQNLKDAVGSAVDVMHAMASSICSLSSKVKEMNSLVLELVSVAANERILLEQCKEHLSTLTAIQVNECSLRSHIIQLNRVPTTGCLTTHA
ncbi:hypothetical protein ERO13_A03G183700v2 [Gossypium hirsutum]|uniref:QWRF motif-containing protein 2 isoform X2 n=3 Tax=Gossypium TaxID=3633 RepID=A0A1U8HKH3_GOSHI|nr:QWRF motif-containing protein 2-like isoform X2 [Gossypium hirsutum]KAB2091552.1 hypothetical protein ES319_A03G199200v1 [Gossypium barbadense]KAG4209235.1 hypothetical protein ERO13_A03G183700v2 [Gossypium hirsutum]TYI37536.1 hypothetical protein ES332_A03G219000v1 [Gossypium tomentosum]